MAATTSLPPLACRLWWLGHKPTCDGHGCSALAPAVWLLRCPGCVMRAAGVYAEGCVEGYVEGYIEGCIEERVEG